MRNGSHRLRRGLALATVISAIAAPTAGAVPIDEPLAGTQAGTTKDEQRGTVDGQPLHRGEYVGSVTALSPPVSSPAANAEVASVPGDRFDWADAGIGAGVMLALTAIAGGAALALGFGRSRHSVA